MRFVRRMAVVWAALSLAACGHTAKSSQPVHVQRSQPPATKAPPSAQPQATPAQTSAPKTPATLAPAVVKHVVRLPPDAAPKILAVAMSETTLHRGDRISGSVVTTSNVASVQARVGGYAVTLNKMGVGRFGLAYTVNIPWFVRGNFTLHVIATNTKGATVERTIPLTVR